MGVFIGFFGSFMRSTRVLCFCAVAVKSGENCKHSSFLKRDCANTSQLCGLTLAPKTDPIGMQSVWSKECKWATDDCGFSYYPEASSSKSRISFPGKEIRMLWICTR